MTTPALPPGFVLENQQNAAPPLPPGFVLEQSGQAQPRPQRPRQPPPQAPEPEQRGNAFTRALGEVGGRQVLQGAAGLLGAIGGDAFNHYILEPIGLHDGRTYRQTASDLADEMGMRKPQTSGERVVSDIGEALTGTALTLGGGALLGPGSRLGRLLTTQPGLQTASAATGSGAQGVARESGAGEGTQIAAGLVGSLAPGIGGAGSGALARGLVRGRSGEAMQGTIRDFNALGANPSVGQTSGNRAIQGTENLLAGAPTSSGVMNRFAERQASDIGGGLRNMADDFSRNASGERAGRAIERGAETFANNIKATRRALYWQADQLIPDTVSLPLSRTRATLAELTTPRQGATATTGALINPKIAQMAQNVADDVAANGGAIPYAAVKDLRSRIGEALSDYSLVADKPTAEYKRLYAALSQDLEEAARKQGPQAERAARRANNYTRASADRIEQVQRVIDKNGGPEKVFNAAMSGTRDGGTTLRAVMQSLPQDGQKAVTAAVIKRMGLATPGAQDAAGEAFSAQTFLTNWNKVSPEAKRALFDRHGPGFSQSMDRIARVAENIRNGSKVFANPSGTANRAAALTYGASLVASLFDLSGVSTAGLVAGGAGANVMARKLTDPRVVNWLAKTTALPRGAIPGAINAMIVEGQKTGNDELLDVARQLQQAEQEQGAGDQ